MNNRIGRRVSLAAAVAFLATAPAAGTRGQGTPDPERITPAMLALGDSIFHGKVGGAMCYVCHGPAARGVTGLGPSLVDAEWLHGDGSYGFLINTIEAGVSKPKKFAAPMPAKGGGQLSTAQVQAAAAYVYSLRPRGK